MVSAAAGQSPGVRTSAEEIVKLYRTLKREDVARPSYMPPSWLASVSCRPARREIQALTENLSSRALPTCLLPPGHDAHSVVEQALGGQPDERVIDACSRERRVPVTLDLDLSNIHADPPARFRASLFCGWEIRRMRTSRLESSACRVVLRQEKIDGLLWIVEEHRIWIHD